MNSRGTYINTDEGKKNIFKIAKQMKEESQDLLKMCCVKDTNGNVVSKPEEVKQRWREYMSGIVNVENDWDHDTSCYEVEGPVTEITEDELLAALTSTKKEKKSPGPSDIVNEMFMCSMETSFR